MEHKTLMAETLTCISAQSPLLTLAPEIRDLIYNMALTTPLPRPQNPTDRSRRQQLYHASYVEFELTTWYPMDPPGNPSSSLLLTCHQLREEIRDLSSLQQKCNKSERYKLSITIMEEKSLYPTWHLVPLVPSEMARLVWADIHIAGYFTLKEQDRSGWFPDSEWVPPLIWGLFTILRKFLLFGPSFSSPRNQPALAEYATYLKSQNHPIRRLKLLVLYVITPTKAEMNGKPFLQRGRSDHYEDKIEGITHPETVIEMLHRYLLDVIQREKHAALHSRGSL